MAVVYQHIRRDTKEIFYIGIGKTEKRAYSVKGRNKRWKGVVRRTDYDVEILFENLTWDQACEREKELIALYGRKDLGTGSLTNLTDGGDGIKNLSKESREKISRKHKGRELTDSHKQKLSEAKKGIKRGPLSEEHRKKISESNKGREFSEESKTKMKAAHTNKPRPWRFKEVFQHNLDGILLNVFESYSAALKATSISGIANNLSGRTKTAGGFIWSYKKIQSAAR